MITYDTVKMKKGWKEYVQKLNKYRYELEFLHSDEFLEQYGDIYGIWL